SVPSTPIGAAGGPHGTGSSGPKVALTPALNFMFGNSAHSPPPLIAVRKPAEPTGIFSPAAPNLTPVSRPLVTPKPAVNPLSFCSRGPATPGGSAFVNGNL